jgi:hypothetical protein
MVGIFELWKGGGGGCLWNGGGIEARLWKCMLCIFKACWVGRIVDLKADDYCLMFILL